MHSQAIKFLGTLNKGCEMGTILIAVTLLSIAICVVVIAWAVRVKRRQLAAINAAQLGSDQNAMGSKGMVDDCEFAILDESGFRLVESRELQAIPESAYRLDTSEASLDRTRHLISDLFKGAVSLPGRTVEITFKPEIQQGLRDGAYTLMRTKSGEVLADAVDASGAVVGKARVIQTGGVRQIAGGAFQLVSIAVAQSHLADIERSLGVIKSSIAEVIERQENEDKARITGAIDYLREITIHMRDLRSPDELSQQKINVIESIVKDSYAWRNKLEEDIESLINKISAVADSDTFGTGSTYEQLKSLICRVEPLLKRRQIVLELSSAIEFITAYLDPTRRNLSRLDPNSERWTAYIEEFMAAAQRQESTLLAKAFWNANETLQLRRDKLRSLALGSSRLAMDQQRDFSRIQESLAKNLGRLMGSDGSVKLAVSFDDRGELKGAAIIE